jgi:hypothetical protein
LVRFEIDSAFQGAEGLEKVRVAHLAGLPYAMAFIDMRKPPGWDGVETAERLWLEEPRLYRAARHRTGRLARYPLLAESLATIGSRVTSPLTMVVLD